MLLDFKAHSLLQYAVSIAITILLLMMALTDSAIFLWVAIALATLQLFKPEVVFVGYFISSLSVGYFSSGTLGAARFFSIITVFSLLVLVITPITNGKQTNLEPRRNDSSYGFMIILEIILLLYCFLSCVFSVTASLVPFWSMAQCLLVTFMMCSKKVMAKIDISLLFNLLSIDCIIVVAFLGFHSMQDASELYVERYSGAEDLNANKYAMMCNQLGAFMMGAFVFTKNKAIKIASIFGLIASTILIIITGSRSALIGLMAAIIFILLLGWNRKRKKQNVFAVLVVGIVFYFFITYFSSTDSLVVQRYSFGNVVETGGSGRLVYVDRIWKEVILKYPIFGVGMGGNNVMALGIPKQAHNIIIDQISQLGLFGFVLFFVFIVSIIGRSIKKLRSGYMLIILPLGLFTAALFNGVGEVVFYEKMFWNSIALCALLNYRIPDKEEYGTI